MKIYYWDACIYLAWLMKESTHGKQHMDAISQIARDNWEQKNMIITSTITYTEVLASKIGPENESQFRKSFTRDHIAYDVDPAIAIKARDFRQNVLAGKDKMVLAGGKKFRPLSVADAIHLATAAIYKADEFNTFDDGEKDTRSIGLLELSGDDRVDRIRICKPILDQSLLFPGSN